MSETTQTLAGRPVGRMIEAEYDQERARLRVLYGVRSKNNAKLDQAIALLFARTGWTQEELAAKEPRARAQIARLLRLGRFLTFTELSSDSLRKSLTEKLFFSYWQDTDESETNERIRFAAVQRLIEADTTIRRDPRPSIRAAIIERFGDGEWHALKTIAAAVADGDEDHVAKTIEHMHGSRASGATTERRRYGTSYQYRIFRIGGRKIGIEEIRTKLGPLIEGLIAEGKKNMATMSPGTVAMLAVRLERLLDEWTK